MRCNKCYNQLLELWSKDKKAIWLACPKCDKPELDQMKQLKLEADINRVMGIKSTRPDTI